jgi:DNA polymerase-3 subunit epsilon
MRDSSNLVRDNRIARDLTTLIRTPGRTVPLAEAARVTMRMENVAPDRLRHIFGQLLAGDPRFELVGDGVRLTEDPREALPLGQLDFVVVDTETTGCSAARSRVIEIAAVRVRGGTVTDRYETLIDPGCPIPPMITRLTGITRASVLGQPSFEQVAPSFVEFVGDAVLVAHNASFDRGMLDAELARAFNRRFRTPFLCTVRLGRLFVPGLPRYNLDTLAAHFHVLIANRHRALGDAEATAEIFVRLLEHIGGYSMRDLRSAKRSAQRGAAPRAAKTPAPATRARRKAAAS